MDTSIQTWINSLSSQNGDERDDALARLIALGEIAVEPLQDTFSTTTEPETRALCMEALATIADANCTDLFFHALDDKLPKVRALAATGLARIRDPRAIEALVKTLHDFPDEGHSQYTLSAYTLIGLGKSALPQVVALLSDENIYTREQAFFILAGIVTRLPEYEYQWDTLWQSLGNYDPTGSVKDQSAAVQKWAAWVQTMVD